MLKDEDKQLLLSKIDIVELISQYVDLKKSGSGYKGLSPFKDEKTPSFMVSPTKKIFKDFSSDIGGDAIRFYMLINKISYLEAIEQLAKKYNVNINLARSNANYYDKYYNLTKKICEYYATNLLNSPIAQNYLKNRGYSLEDIKKFKLGYAKNAWDDIYKAFSKEDINILLELGLVAKGENGYYDIFRDRIMIPIFNKKGDIVGFGGRDISAKPEVAKYINSKESKIFKKSNELYGIFDGGNIIEKYNSCMLVEGYFDVLALHKADIRNSIASLGTALTANQVKYIKKLTENILIAYDNDSAGLAAKIRAILLLNNYGFNVKVMDYSNMGKDPDEILKNYGKDAFIEEIKKSEDAFDFLYKYYLAEGDIEKLGVKRKLIKEMNSYFASIKNPIYYEEFIKKFAKKLNISIEALKSNLVKSAKMPVEERKVTTKSKKQINNRQRQLEEMTIFLLYKDFKKGIKEKLSLFEKISFSNIYFSQMFEKLYQNDFKVENLSNEESRILFDLTLKYDDIKIDYVILYREWILQYIKNSREMIVNYFEGYDNMNDEDYASYMSFVSRVKHIEKSVDLPKIKKVYDDYLEYEKGKMHAL